MNVSYPFGASAPADGSVEYVYDVQAPGSRKVLNVDSIFRRLIKGVEALDGEQLALTFDNGDTLIVYDSPKTRSAWFYRYQPNNHNAALLWAEDDAEGEDDA